MTRPTKNRSAARVIVLSPEEEVLLIADSDPGVEGSEWWVTPGGGIEEGESPEQAAARELEEETGLRVDAADLEGPVGKRVVTHGYSDRIRVQDEVFYRVTVERFDPVTDGLSEDERTRVKRVQWWPLAALPGQVWPAELRALASVERETLDMGEVEESTVPVEE